MLYKSVLFVAHIPEGVLVKELRKREMNKTSKGQIKIEEKGGIEIKDILATKNP